MSTINIKKSLTRHRNRRRAKQYRYYTWSLRSLVAVMAVLGGFAGAINQVQRPAVLAYATNVSHSGLLASTNQQRVGDGVAALTMETRLNSAAQAKAQDMVDKDYWSHTSPDGRQPWDFILAAGYSYNRAGENLAYGALTSSETVQAWMNSPGHRANIMNSGFSQVGFGFANSPNYQNRGPQTVVVAMYATPYGSPAPAPAPKPAPQPAPAPQPTPTPAPVTPTPPPNPNPAPQAPSRPEPNRSVEQSSDKPSDISTAQEDEISEGEDSLAAALIDHDGNETVASIDQAQPIRRISLVSGNFTPWAVAIVVVFGLVSMAVFLYRHSRALHRWTAKGEQFIVRHPVIDAVAVMTVITVVVLLQSVGQVL